MSTGSTWVWWMLHQQAVEGVEGTPAASSLVTEEAMEEEMEGV